MGMPRERSERVFEPERAPRYQFGSVKAAGKISSFIRSFEGSFRCTSSMIQKREDVTLSNYIFRIITVIDKCSHEPIGVGLAIVAMCLWVSLELDPGDTPHELFACCFWMAQKICDDLELDAKVFGKCTGVNKHLLMDFERDALLKLNWRVQIDPVYYALVLYLLTEEKDTAEPICIPKPPPPPKAPPPPPRRSSSTGCLPWIADGGTQTRGVHGWW